MTKYLTTFEFIRQHMTYFTQHMKISFTTHVNNLYNVYKKYTTHDQLLNNINDTLHRTYDYMLDYISLQIR